MRVPFSLNFVLILNPVYWFLVPSVKIGGIYIFSIAWLLFGFQITALSEADSKAINETLENLPDETEGEV